MTTGSHHNGSETVALSGATMPSLTLKNIPTPVLQALRESAEASRRSINQQAIQLLSRALGLEGGGISPERVVAQVEAWRRLAGRWKSDLSPEQEIAAIRKARTRGRKVDL
ncbi:MAG: hypothetical protein QM704_00775 [Anaeromyxobacteraceae bacterium]